MTDNDLTLILKSELKCFVSVVTDEVAFKLEGCAFVEVLGRGCSLSWPCPLGDPIPKKSKMMTQD